MNYSRRETINLNNPEEIFPLMCSNFILYTYYWYPLPPLTKNVKMCLTFCYSEYVRVGTVLYGRDVYTSLIYTIFVQKLKSSTFIRSNVFFWRNKMCPPLTPENFLTVTLTPLLDPEVLD